MRHAIVALFIQLGQLWWIGGTAGCSDSGKLPVPPREVIDIPVIVNGNLDLLFLIDDSPATASFQLNLANNFPRFIDVLSSMPGGLPSLHIGVATPDMGTRGEDGQPPGLAVGQGDGSCAGFGKDGVMQLGGVVVNGTDKFISDLANPDGTRQRNYTGNLTDVFAQMAKVGARGCAFEQHLAAVKRALTNPVNAGFLRPDADLGVIILADKDDCSMEHASLLADDPFADATLGALQSFRCTRFGVLCDQGGQTPDAMNQVGTKHQCHPNDTSAYLAKVSDYVKFLKNLKPEDPSKVVVAGILGTIDPFAVELRPPRTGAMPIPALAHACTYSTAVSGEAADPAVRTKFFLDQFPNRSASTSICQDLSGGLQQIGFLFKKALGDPCIQGVLADTDPKTPGLQDECDVTVTDPTRAMQLPRCTPEDATATNQPCWHLAADPARCLRSDHLKIVVEGVNTLPVSAHVIVSCTIVPVP